MTLVSPIPFFPDASVFASWDLLWALPFGLAGLALLRLVLLRGPGRALAEPGTPAWRRALAGAAAAAVLLLAVVLPPLAGGAFGPAAAGYAKFTPPRAAANPAAAPSSLVFFAAQSLVEELVFRAALLTILALLALGVARALRGRLPADDAASLPRFARRWMAAGLVANAVQAVAFAALHSGNPHVTRLALFNIALAGSVLGWLFWSGGGLAGAWAFHAVWNWGLSALGLPVSGMALGTPLVSAGLSGAGRPLLSGGAFGPEGSLVTSVALAVLLACLVARSARRLRTG